MEFVQARALGEAATHLATGDMRVLAGGTDLAVEYRRKLPRWRGLVHVGRVPELQGVAVANGAFTIGAAVPYARIAAHPCADAGFAMLRDAAVTIGSPGIMAMGTLGGNIATASPSGDGSLALCALDATIAVASVRGERHLPIDDVFVGPRRSVLAADEIIVSVTFPCVGPQRRGAAFRKIGNRDASILAVAAVAVVIDADEEGSCTRARVAFGAVAPTPRRAPAVEAQLIGRPVADLWTPELPELVSAAIAPIDDQRSSAWYREQVMPVLLQDALTEAQSRLTARRS
jgi:CO/xanthine dehydrogenase FAD-binding subunit